MAKAPVRRSLRQRKIVSYSEEHAHEDDKFIDPTIEKEPKAKKKKKRIQKKVEKEVEKESEDEEFTADITKEDSVSEEASLDESDHLSTPEESPVKKRI